MFITERDRRLIEEKYTNRIVHQLGKQIVYEMLRILDTFTEDDRVEILYSQTSHFLNNLIDAGITVITSSSNTPILDPNPSIDDQCKTILKDLVYEAVIKAKDSLINLRLSYVSIRLETMKTHFVYCLKYTLQSTANYLEIIDLLTKREIATLTIQRGCHAWLFKPVARDGTVGIVPRLQLRKF